MSPSAIRPVATLCLAFLSVASFGRASTPDPETPEQAAERMAWWREARFGMFIHWSPSSVGGVEIGWDRHANRPMEAGFNGGGPAGPGVDPVYDNYYKKFNPTAYDPAEWVRIAEGAGMKYMVLTSKHHEGFAMWPTKARTGFDISATPYKGGKGDVLREFADACHEAKMRFGWYYSPRDWTNPDYGAGDNAKYLAFMRTQMDELFSNYGKVDLVWWDSFGMGDSYKFWQADRTLAQVRALQPGIITNNRCSNYVETNRKGLEGDFDTPEGSVGKYRIKRPWETCITLVGHHWSFQPGGDLKSFDWVISTLVGCATGDGNLLLNVGPMPDGRIEPRQADLLKQVGAWMTKYGEAIYGTRGGPFPNGAWGGVTFKGDALYLHVLPACPDTIVFPKLDQKLTAHRVLTGGEAEVTEKDGILTVKIPKSARTTPVTLLKLTFDKPVTRVEGRADVVESELAGLKDIGRDATWTASSLVPKWSAEKAKLLTGDARGDFAFHTEDEKNPSVTIDLKSGRHVSALVIKNRPGSEFLAATLTLSASEDGVTWTPVWKAEKPETRWFAVPESVVAGAKMKGVPARYLKLETHNDTPRPLHLKAVQVYGE